MCDWITSDLNTISLQVVVDVRCTCTSLCIFYILECVLHKVDFEEVPIDFDKVPTPTTFLVWWLIYGLGVAEMRFKGSV